MEFLQSMAIATIVSKKDELKAKPTEASGVYPPGRSVGLPSSWGSSKIVGFEARELQCHGCDARGIWPWKAQSNGLGKPLSFFVETPYGGQKDWTTPSGGELNGQRQENNNQ